MAIVARLETSLVLKQEEITNKLFADVRAATNSSVETFSDLAELVMHTPETDEAVVSIFVNSGYLSTWELIRARDPHWYDAEVYARVVPVEQQKQIADESYDSRSRFVAASPHYSQQPLSGPIRISTEDTRSSL